MKEHGGERLDGYITLDEMKSKYQCVFSRNVIINISAHSKCLYGKCMYFIVHQNLVVDKETGAIVGFVDFDDKSEGEDLATHILGEY